MDLLNYPEDIDPAGVSLDRVQRQSLLVRETDKRAWAKQLKWLYEDFAELNRFKVGVPFNPATLINPKAGRRWRWDPLPGTHLTYFRRVGWPVAIISEPESEQEAAALLAFAAKYGLRVNSPPNPRASFRNPGLALFQVLTHPEADEVEWLPPQLEFRG